MSTKSNASVGLPAPVGIKKSKKSKKSVHTVEVPGPVRSMSAPPTTMSSDAVVWKQMYEQLQKTIEDTRLEAACAHVAARNKWGIPEDQWAGEVASLKQSHAQSDAPQPLRLKLTGRAPKPMADPESEDDDALSPPPATKSNQKSPKKPKRTAARSAANHYYHFVCPVLRDGGMPVAGPDGCMTEANKRWKSLTDEEKAPFIRMNLQEKESMASDGTKLTEDQLRALCPESTLAEYDAAKASLDAKKSAAGAAPAEEAAEETAEEAGAPAAEAGADALDDDE